MTQTSEHDTDGIETANLTVDELIEAWEQGDITPADGELVTYDEDKTVEFVFEGVNGELRVPYVIGTPALRTDTNESIELPSEQAEKTVENPFYRGGD